MYVSWRGSPATVQELLQLFKGLDVRTNISMYRELAFFIWELVVETNPFFLFSIQIKCIRPCPTQPFAYIDLNTIDSMIKALEKDGKVFGLLLVRLIFYIFRYESLASYFFFTYKDIAGYVKLRIHASCPYVPLVLLNKERQIRNSWIRVAKLRKRKGLLSQLVLGWIQYC